MPPRSKEDQSLWRQNLQRSHLFRKEHTELLAKPNWRRVMKIDPYTELRNLPRDIPKPTLKASPTERIEMLAVPKKREDMEERPVPTVIDPRTLSAKCKDTVKLLAISKLPKLIHHKFHFRQMLGKTFVERMDKQIKEREDNMWKPPPHRKWLGIPKKKVKKFKSDIQFNKYLEKLLTFARPKRQFPPEKVTRKKVPLANLMTRILDLSVPSERQTKKPPPERPIVRPEALDYEATDRIKELSVPRKFYVPDPGPPKTAAGVSIAALKYKITERDLALATPRDRRNAPDLDTKENAFEISPLALKYVITPRMAKLALPVQRG